MCEYVAGSARVIKAAAKVSAFQSCNSQSHNTSNTPIHTPTGVCQADQVPELTCHTRVAAQRRTNTA